MPEPVRQLSRGGGSVRVSVRDARRGHSVAVGVTPWRPNSLKTRITARPINGGLLACHVGVEQESTCLRTHSEASITPNFARKASDTIPRWPLFGMAKRFKGTPPTFRIP